MPRTPPDLDFFVSVLPHTIVLRAPEPTPPPTPAPPMLVMLDLLADGTIAVTEKGGLPTYRTAVPLQKSNLFCLENDYWIVTEAFQDLGTTSQRYAEFRLAVGFGQFRPAESRTICRRVMVSALRSQPHLNSIQQIALDIAIKHPAWKQFIASKNEPFFGSGN